MSFESLLGQTLENDRYEVVSQLGEGGMGTVYLGKDSRLDTDIVIKVPHRAMLAEKEFGERFQREIQSLVKLSHPHVVNVIDVGEFDGLPFVVMQYLGGGSLADRRSTPNSFESILEWLPEIAKALDFIHKKGYIHRDVKPANILFDENGNSFLGDFGIAKVAAAAEEKKRQLSLTGTGIAMGTPEYMAPELCDGRPIDNKVDQYALAVTVYELLSGRCPMIGATPLATIFMHKTHEPQKLLEVLPGIPDSVSEAVERAMSKEPGERFPSCRQFAEHAIGNQSSTFSTGNGLPPTPSPEGKSVNPPSFPADTRKNSPPPTTALKEKRPELPETVDRYTDKETTEYQPAEKPKQDSATPNQPKKASVLSKTDLVDSQPPPLPVADQSLQPTVNRTGNQSSPPKSRRDPCPKCEKLLRVPSNMVGKIVVCPNCNVRLTVSELSLKLESGPHVTVGRWKQEAPAGTSSAASSPQTAKRSKPAVESSTPTWVKYFWGVFAVALLVGAFFGWRYLQENRQILDDVKAWENAFSNGESTENFVKKMVEEEKRFDMWKRKAESGNSNAQVLLADCYEMGIGVSKDEKKAFEWYKKSADQKNSTGEWSVGLCYQQGKGVDVDQKEAVNWFRKSADQENAIAQNRLAVCHRYGYGVTKSNSEALKLYLEAAKNGNAASQYALGDAYWLGYELVNKKKDLNKALEYYKQAGEQGHAKAQYYVGYFYNNGYGTAKNEKTAFEWFLRSANNDYQPYARAENQVGLMYRQGLGVDQDEQSGFIYYQRAAANGSSMAMYNIGTCYEFGRGTRRDRKKALEWYKKAAAKGNSSAKTKLETFKE